MIDLASEETRRNPYALYRTVRALARVVREPTTGLWLALDNESVRETLQNHESFSSVIAGSGGQVHKVVCASAPDSVTAGQCAHEGRHGVVARIDGADDLARG